MARVGRGGEYRGLGRVRGIPATPWSQTGSRWTSRPSGLAVLLAGLWIFGTGEAMLLASRLGNSPWTVLAQGISEHTPLSIGACTFAVSAAVLLLWIPLRERPGIGTILNAVVISVAIDAMLAALPEPDGALPRTAFAVAGVVTVGAGSALYLTANLGPGPRDGLMTALHRRFGWRIAAVRTGLELSACVSGAILGGTIGVGTVMFALGIGPVLSGLLAALRRRYPAARPPAAPRAEVVPE